MSYRLLMNVFCVLLDKRISINALQDVSNDLIEIILIE
jgi:hypothetical protein